MSCESNTILCDSDPSVHVLLFPLSLRWVVRIVERDDVGALNFIDGEALTIGELSSPFASVVMIAFVLVGSILIIAASGVGFVPGELSSLGKGGNNEGSGNENFSEHQRYY